MCLAVAWSLPKCAWSLPGLTIQNPGLCPVFCGFCQGLAWSSKLLLQITAWSLPICAWVPPGLVRRGPSFRLGLLFVERVLLWFFRKPCQGFLVFGFLFWCLVQVSQLGLQRGSAYGCALTAPTTCASRRPTTSRHIVCSTNSNTTQKERSTTHTLRLNGQRDTTLTLR